MDLRIAKNILEKYYNGESSVQQERDLKIFLKKYKGNDDELVLAQHLFSTLNDEAEETIALDFDTIVGSNKVLKFKKPLYNYLASAAAVFLLAFAIAALIKTSQQTVVYAYIDGKPITNKKIAIAHSQKALYNISSQFNKGTKGLNHIEKLNKPVELLTVKK